MEGVDQEVWRAWTKTWRARKTWRGRGVHQDVEGVEDMESMDQDVEGVDEDVEGM